MNVSVQCFSKILIKNVNTSSKTILKISSWECYSQDIEMPELENSERKNEILPTFLHDAVGRVQK